MLGQFALAAGGFFALVSVGFVLGCLFCFKFGAKVIAHTLRTFLDKGYLVKTALGCKEMGED